MRRTVRALAVALAALATTAPVAFGGVPAVDEYTLRPPDAGGRNLGPKAPNPRVDTLPAATRKAIEASPDGGTIAQVATARELGAPEVLTPASGVGGGAATAAGTGSGESGAGGAALSALTEPAALGVLALLVGIAGVAMLRRRSLT